MKIIVVSLAFLSVISIIYLVYLFNKISNSTVEFRKLPTRLTKAFDDNIPQKFTTRKQPKTKQKPKNIEFLNPNYENIITESDSPVILLWSPPWGLISEGFISGKLRSGCRVTYDKSNLTQAVAVVFHFTSLSINPFPSFYERDPKQVFVWHCQESPFYLKHISKQFLQDFEGNFINWTMTYRTDSDIFLPRVRSKAIYQHLNGGRRKVDQIIKKKSKMILWIPSKRHESQVELFRKQLKYAEGLVKFGAKVHVANRNDSQKPISEWSNAQEYKFYLAFEDTEYCKDYLTSQFWELGINQNRVPIVWGATKFDVNGIAPPGSFIHVDDFEDAQHLAEHLLYLDHNSLAYRKYFSWVEKPDARTRSFARIYKNVGLDLLCRNVLNNKISKSISSIESYYFDTFEDTCLL